MELDGTETRAQAVAIKDGKFAFVGSDEGVKDFIGENTVVTDCEGGSILPGFADAHMVLTLRLHFRTHLREFLWQ